MISKDTKAKPPIFPCVGGKGRIRRWVAEYVPFQADRYIEPFAGKGIQMSLTGGRERRTECLWSNVVG